MKINIKTKNKGGVMMLTVLFFLVLGTFIVAGVSFMASKDISNMNSLLSSGSNFYVAESGIEDAVYRLKYGLPLSSNTIVLDGKSATVTVSTSTSSTTISSLSSTNNFYKKIQVGVSAGSGVAFNYGIQAGASGFNISGGSTVNGNVYSNGSIVGIDGVHITGTAIAAGASTIGGATWAGGINIGSSGVGNAWARNVVGAKVAGSLYCTTGSNNNKSCDKSKGDAPSVSLPYTDQNITDWKNAAAAGGTISGNYSVDWDGDTLGPKKITGSLTVNGGGTLVLTGPLWVVGNITVNGGGKIVLPAAYAKSSETIVSDGLINLSGGSNTGSGATSSYLFFVTTNSSVGKTDCSGTYAITVTGGAGTIAINAQNGGISLTGDASLNAATAKYICMSGGSDVVYDQGLASPYFVSGPKGGYAITSWGEL